MSAKIDIRPDHLTIVQDILHKHLPQGISVYVFGSRATWNAKDYSDLDLALLKSKTEPTKIEKDVLLNLENDFEESDLPWKVDLVDLSAITPKFKAIIEKDRVELPLEANVKGGGDYKLLKHIVRIKGGKRLPKGANLQEEHNSHSYIRVQDMTERFIGLLDDKIELNRTMNQTLEAMAQALFKSWFVDFDPVIDNAIKAGNPIPEALAKKAQQRADLLAQQKQQPRTTDPDIASHFPSEFEHTKEMGWIPKGWEISEVGQEFDVTMGQSPPGSTHYSMLQLRSKFKSFESEGTIFGSNNFNTLTQIKIPIGLINTFEKNARALDLKIESNSSQNQNFENLRDTLLPKLLSGELRIPDAEQLINEC